jgi:hypothetical protein
MATSTITPAAVTPAAPAAPITPAANPDASMGDLLRVAGAEAAAATPEPAPSITSPETPATPPATPEVPAEGTPPTPTPEVPPGEAPTPPEDVLDLTGGVEPDSIDADGKRHFYTVAKSQRLQAAGKLVQSLQEVMPVVTPEAIRERIERANAADYMMTKYQAAAQDPGQVKELIDLFATDEQGQATPDTQAAFSALIFEGLSRLPQVNPKAFQHVLAVHNNHTVTALRDRARQLVDPAAREQAVALALRFEEAVTGKFTPSQQWLQNQPQDPIEAGRQQLERERADFQRQRLQVRQTEQQRWAGHVGSTQEQAVASEVDAQLAVVKDPSVAPYLNNMRSDLLQAVAKAELEHPEWQNAWENLQQQALLKPSEQTLRAVTDFRRNIAKRVVRANAQAVIERYSNVALANNQAAHLKAGQRPPNEPTPNGVGTPAPNGAIEKAITEPDLAKSLRLLMANSR